MMTDRVNRRGFDKGGRGDRLALEEVSRIVGWNSRWKMSWGLQEPVSVLHTEG